MPIGAAKLLTYQQTKVQLLQYWVCTEAPGSLLRVPSVRRATRKVGRSTRRVTLPVSRCGGTPAGRSAKRAAVTASTDTSSAAKEAQVSPTGSPRECTCGRGLTQAYRSATLPHKSSTKDHGFKSRDHAPSAIQKEARPSVRRSPQRDASEPKAADVISV